MKRNAFLIVLLAVITIGLLAVIIAVVFAHNTTSSRLTVMESSQAQRQGSYKIGDAGPGGGIIFSVKSDSCIEVGRILGDLTWNEATQAAQKFNGGGYSDWHLPSKSELNLIYQNLQKSGAMNLGMDWYWSSSQYSAYHAWGQNFGDGIQGNGDKNLAFSVCVVRTF